MTAGSAPQSAAAAVDIAEFVRARLDEDERAARWVTDDYASHSAEWAEPSSGVLDIGDELVCTGDSPVSRFMARFDPARMLRAVAGKRRMMLEHEKCATNYTGRRPATPDVVEHVHVEFCSCQAPDGAINDVWPCTFLRLLASEWNDHPDYEEAWRP